MGNTVHKSEALACLFCSRNGSYSRMCCQFCFYPSNTFIFTSCCDVFPFSNQSIDLHLLHHAMMLKTGPLTDLRLVFALQAMRGLILGLNRLTTKNYLCKMVATESLTVSRSTSGIIPIARTAITKGSRTKNSRLERSANACR
jgi:hypothetical protein